MGIAALAVLVLVGSTALLVHASCTPSGATRSPEQARQPEDKTPDPDPEDINLMAPSRPRGALT